MEHFLKVLCLMHSSNHIQETTPQGGGGPSRLTFVYSTTESVLSRKVAPLVAAVENLLQETSQGDTVGSLMFIIRYMLRQVYSSLSTIDCGFHSGSRLYLISLLYSQISEDAPNW